VEPVWTSGLGASKPGATWVRDLQPGESRDLSFSVEVTERYVREHYRVGAPTERMLAFKARSPGDSRWPRSAFAFKYWKLNP
jgi:hypothetical protein